MGIFGLNQKDRRLTVALKLGLNPKDRKSWPMDIIDRILYEAEHEAERHMTQVIYHLTRSGRCIR